MGFRILPGMTPVVFDSQSVGESEICQRGLLGLNLVSQPTAGSFFSAQD